MTGPLDYNWQIHSFVEGVVFKILGIICIVFIFIDHLDICIPIKVNYGHTFYKMPETINHMGFF